jgi:RNA polymerase sigma-70 factor (ECF subfamily)
MKDPNVIPGRGKGDDVGSTSETLLEGVRVHSAAAWEQLIVLYAPVVYSWARRTGLRSEDAADMVQEVFLAVDRNLPSFRHGPGDTFRGWLWTILKNKIYDLGRRKKDRPEAEGGSDAYQRLLHAPEAPEMNSTESGGSPRSALLTRALNHIRSDFKEESWRAFWGVVMEGRRPTDVASALGLSVNAVYIARSRILRRLRDELGEPPV